MAKKSKKVSDKPPRECDYDSIKSWKKARERLELGNSRYKSGNLEHPNQHKKCREYWAPDDQNGQRPWCIVLSCADSRVTPELVFDTGIGDLFVARVAGNIANASTIASIEYAASAIKDKSGRLTAQGIVVLGHEGCGAVKAATEVKDNHNAADSPALQHLVGHIMPALETKPRGKDEMAGYVRANARLAARDLCTRSKIIRESKLPIYPAYYRLKSGDVEFMDAIER
ncbi:MAG: carbonic anhydrase [Planctomycetota bacterium]